MARTVYSSTFRYTPLLTGGDLGANFDPNVGRGWNRSKTYFPPEAMVPALYKADGSVLRHINRFQSRDVMTTGTIAGKDREPYFNMTRLEKNLYDPRTGSGNVGLITRDLSGENWEIEFKLTMLMPEVWPAGGSGNNNRWQHTLVGGLVLFAPTSIGGYNDFFPCYRLYWIRHSHNHATKPAQQEIWGEWVTGWGDVEPDYRGVYLTGESGNLEILGTQPIGATYIIPELEEEGSAVWRLVLRKNPNGDGIIMRVFFDDYLVGRSLPTGGNIAPGDLGFGRGRLESEGWISGGAPIEDALKRTFGFCSYVNAGTNLSIVVEPTWPATYSHLLLERYRIGFDTYVIKDQNDSTKPYIFPKPELETEPLLTTVTLEDEDAGTSATELTLDVDGRYVIDERMEVTEFEYTTGHLAAIPKNSKSRGAVEFHIRIENSTDLTTFKTFISTITAPGEDGIFTYDDETWRLIGTATITGMGAENAWFVKFTAEAVYA